MDRKGSVPSWPRDPVLQDHGSRQLPPPAPRSRIPPGPRKGRATGIDEGRRTLPAREGKTWATEMRREQTGIPRLLCTAATATRLGKSRSGRAAATLPRTPGGWRSEPWGPQTHLAPSPGSSRRNQHLGGQGVPAPPCPHLMLTPFATRKVCLEARSWGGGEGSAVGCWGGDCKAIKNKIQSEIPLCADGERRREASASEMLCGRAPRPVAKGRCAPAEPGCPAGTGPPARGLPVAWWAVLTRSGDLLSLGHLFSEAGTFTPFGAALSRATVLPEDE